MADEKFERRLLNVVETERLRSRRAGMSPEEFERVPFEVTVSHQERIEAPEDVSIDQREEAVAGLASRIEQSQAPILARLAEIAPDEERTVHQLVNAVTTRLTLLQMRALSELDEVEIIRSEAPEMVTCMNETVQVIEATEAWSELHATGDDVRVALLDTGADKNHPALAGKVVDEVSTVPTEPVTVRGNHGTHTAGTIVSNDSVYRGVAWEADLINIKVLTAFGFGQPSFVIQGLTEAVLRRARVASISLGWSELWGWVCNDADCVLCQAADNAVRLGVCVVVAAGNEGNAAVKPPFLVRHPGAARRVVTVGATDKAKVLAPFSSVGPGSGRLSPPSPIRVTKPEVAGPRVAVVSSVLGGGFGSLSGTSMATPHVAGLAALLIQKRHHLRPVHVKKLLEESCEPLNYGVDDVGYGLINAYGSTLRVA
jgi:serine protease AprX